MYLFDIDGTLLLTGGAGSIAINQLFSERYGVQGAMDTVSAGGKTDDMIFQECARKDMQRDLSEEEVRDLVRAYVPLLRAELLSAPSFRLMPFVRECMAFVSEIHDIVGIATGNVEGAAMAKLERAELADHFHFGGYGSDSPRRPELVAAAMRRGRERAGRTLSDEEFVVVGDTLHDITAARANGARVIAVATGSVSKEVLGAAQPDALFDTLEELPEWHHRHFKLGTSR
ncbi:MAG: HAD family hydrolase [Myxococcales bacterium]|nr:HAD family hydrolase [Myxococcales bacterium]